MLDHTDVKYRKVLYWLNANNEQSKKKILECLAKPRFGGFRSGEDGKVYFHDIAVPKNVVRRYTYLVKNKIPLTGLELFLEKLAKNPSKASQADLLRFMDNCDLPITDDGDFLAYKRVNKDYTDMYSGRFDNHVGQTVKMKRSAVDADSHVDCSTGFHVCSLDYLRSFSGPKLMVCKVNPKNVVAVPIDAYSKIRVCEYYVYDEIKGVTDEVYRTLSPMAVFITKDGDKKDAPGKAVARKETAKVEKPVKAKANPPKPQAKQPEAKMAGVKVEGKEMVRMSAGDFAVMLDEVLSPIVSYVDIHNIILSELDRDQLKNFKKVVLRALNWTHTPEWLSNAETVEDVYSGVKDVLLTQLN
jgi:hypothetical protein